MYSAGYHKHELQFIKPARTSRGEMQTHTAWYISLTHRATGKKTTGEAAPLVGLSIDDRPDFEQQLAQYCTWISESADPRELDFSAFPSIGFAIECALLQQRHKEEHMLFDTGFTKGKGIPINGLVWMDKIDQMREEALKLIERGFECIKLKIGALDFEEECKLLAFIREQKGGDKLILRVDANGGFRNDEALYQLNELKHFNLHSIEQPIKKGQQDLMAELCAKSPVPIALDEELIGVHAEADMQKLLSGIKPQFIVLKPNLVGGFVQSDLWVKHAQKNRIGWWITSALESNIGLNAIAQYAAGFQSILHSGLGTGQLYESNFQPYIRVEKGYLWRDMGTVSSDTYSPQERTG